MTIKELKQLFDEYQYEDNAFNQLEEKTTNRPDLHAFILLDDLVPSSKRIIASVDHDKIYLDVNMTNLCSIITEKDVEILCSCGVWFDSEHDCLIMYV